MILKHLWQYGDTKDIETLSYWERGSGECSDSESLIKSYYDFYEHLRVLPVTSYQLQTNREERFSDFSFLLLETILLMTLYILLMTLFTVK